MAMTIRNGLPHHARRFVAARPARLFIVGLFMVVIVIGLGLPVFPGHNTVQPASGGSGWFGRKKVDVSRLRVAVLEPSMYHAEVVAAVLGVMDDLNAETTLYARQVEVTDALHQIVHGSSPKWITAPWDLAGASIASGDYDVAIITTCDVKFWMGGGGSEEILDDLRFSASTRVVCIPHEIESYGYRMGEDDFGMVGTFGLGQRLDYVTLGAHSARALTHSLRRFARDNDQPFWENTPIESFAPVFEVPATVPKKTHRKQVTKAGIVGRIDLDHRDYSRILQELEQSIMLNPQLWGYEVIHHREAGATSSTLRLSKVDDDAFTLHLIGFASDRQPIYPALLLDEDSPVVHIHEGASTAEFYTLVRDLDVLLPAFIDDLYVQARSSASIPTAVIAETPLLANAPLLEAYTYLNPINYILSPLAWSAVASLATLRRGGDPWVEEFGAVPPPAPPPLQPHWWTRRSEQPEHFSTSEEYRRALRSVNAEVWRRILAKALP